MRTLAESDSSWSSEKQAQEIEVLRKEVQEWKTRYARSKAQVRNLRASTYGTNSAFTQPHANSIEKMYLAPYGMIYDVSVSKFQISIDEFILQSRAAPAKELLEHLHEVVVATRAISQDLSNSPKEDMEQLNPNLDELQNELSQATSLVSATANHLITTTRNHSTSGGLSPMFLLDAAASDLSAAVIDLIKIAKVRPFPGTRDSVDGYAGSVQSGGQGIPSTANGGHNIQTSNSHDAEVSSRNVPTTDNHASEVSLGGPSGQSQNNESNGYVHDDQHRTEAGSRNAPIYNSSPAEIRDVDYNQSQNINSDYVQHSSTHDIEAESSNTYGAEVNSRDVDSAREYTSNSSHTETNHAGITHQHNVSNISGLDIDLAPMNRNRYGSVIPNAETLKFDMSNPADNTVIELQEYLENETASVIDSIQQLLTGIKSNSNYKTLRQNITIITDSVRTMLAATSGMMMQSKHWQLKEHGAYIVDSLENCCQRMKMLYGDSAIHDESLVPDKHFKQRLAGLSFDMAKCTTELVKTVEEVNLKQEIGQINEKLERA